MTTASRRRRHQLMLALLAAIAGLAATVMAEAPKAAAHSDLTASSPTAGSRGVLPKSVVLTFSEDVEPSFARVTLAVDGAEPATLPTQVTGAEVSATPPTAPEQTDAQQVWKVAYRVVSGDGHPITGTLTFTVEPVPSTQGTTTQGTTTQGTAGQDGATPPSAPSPSPKAATVSPTPTPAAGSATPTSTVPPGFPAESDVHGNASRTWPFIIIMGGLLLVVPAMAGLFRLLPEDPGGVIAAQAAADGHSGDDAEVSGQEEGPTPDQPPSNGSGARPAEPPSPT